MHPNQAILGVLLAAVATYLVVKALLSLRTARRQQVAEERAPDPMAFDLAAAFPAMRDTRKQLQQMLWTAGYYRPSALAEYLALRAVLFLGPVFATGLLALLVSPEQITAVVFGGVLAAGLGFSLPRVILSMQASGRSRRLVHGLPVALDVIALCLTAGQNLLNSLEQAGRELTQASPDVALELRILHQQARMHSLEKALLQWAARLNLGEVRSLALLLVQSDRLGTDMVTTLLEFADNQRILLRHRAEAQTNRTNFWMLFPSVFCLWIASAIVLVGPAYIEFVKYRREQMDTLLQGARDQVERSTGTPVAAPADAPNLPAGAPRPDVAAGPN